MKYVGYLNVLILLLLFSCGQNQNSGSSFYQSKLIDKDISLEKVDEFTLHNGPDMDYTIGELHFDFATNSAGDRYAFYDEKNKQILLTDKSGEIQQVISKEGRGPGEIVNIAGFDIDEEDRLMLYDDRQEMIKIFNDAGELLSTAELDPAGYPMMGRDLVASDGKIFAGVFDQSLLGNLMDSAYTSKVGGTFDYEGELTDTVGRYDPTVKEAKTYNIFSMVNVDFENDHFLSAHNLLE